MWLTILSCVGGTALAAVGLYALHRLALRLEERGQLYYLHKRATTSASRMWTPLQEAVEPQVRHVAEAEGLHRAGDDDREGDPERPGTWRRRPYSS